VQGAVIWGAGKIKDLIDSGAQIDYVNQQGLTLMHLAASAGNINVVSSLIALQIFPVDQADVYVKGYPFP